MVQKDWRHRAATILKVELKRKDITYPELSARLEAIGIHETTASIVNKISRGSFSFAFFLQCMQVIDIHTLHLEWNE